MKESAVGMIVPPRIRTVMYGHRYTLLYRLAFPELIFVLSEQKFYCFVRDEWSYFPFGSFNIAYTGEVCMPESFPDRKIWSKSLPSAMDWFWNSKFDASYTMNMMINETINIKSVPEWAQMTRQAPDFMERLFNPTIFGSANRHYNDRFDHHKIDWIESSLREKP